MVERVRIGPIYFTVIEVDEVLKNDDGEEFHGEVDHASFTIKIHRQHTPESRFVTMWHEALHCLEALYDVELSEQQVTALGTCVAQILMDNPHMRWGDRFRSDENR